MEILIVDIQRQSGKYSAPTQTGLLRMNLNKLQRRRNTLSRQALWTGFRATANHSQNQSCPFHSEHCTLGLPFIATLMRAVPWNAQVVSSHQPDVRVSPFPSCQSSFAVHYHSRTPEVYSQTHNHRLCSKRHPYQGCLQQKTPPITL